jgi:hypothetical protein
MIMEATLEPKYNQESSYFSNIAHQIESPKATKQEQYSAAIVVVAKTAVAISLIKNTNKNLLSAQHTLKSLKFYHFLGTTCFLLLSELSSLCGGKFYFVS